MSVSSGRRGQSIAEDLEEGLRQRKLAIKNREGSLDSGWILLDCFDVVVHIFEEEARNYYNLDRLWADAPRLKLPRKINVSRKNRKLPKKLPPKNHI